MTDPAATPATVRALRARVASQDGGSAVERTFRSEWAGVVAALARAFGDLDLAEDATQEAFAVAVRTWPETGVPPNPGGWITTTARRRAIDRLRREAVGDRKRAEVDLVRDWVRPDVDAEGELVDDDVLRLVFTCCHPALDQPAQVALTLRLVAGLHTAEIARAFLVPEATLAQRLVRAKNKIRAAAVPFRMPEDAELPSRLAQVSVSGGLGAGVDGGRGAAHRSAPSVGSPELRTPRPRRPVQEVDRRGSRCASASGHQPRRSTGHTSTTSSPSTTCRRSW